MHSQLLFEIFNSCDNRRVADESEAKLMSDLEDAREQLLLAADGSLRVTLQRYFELNERAYGYIDRAYFCEGFAAAVRLMNDCGIEPVV